MVRGISERYRVGEACPWKVVQNYWRVGCVVRIGKEKEEKKKEVNRM